jgi:hypothetical protein
VEFGLQCDYLLGQHCGGVEQLKNDAQHNVIQTIRRFAPPDHRGKRLSRGEAAVSRARWQFTTEEVRAKLAHLHPSF